VVMQRLRADPPDRLAGLPAQTTDLLQRRGSQRTDALIFAASQGDSWARVVVRPSGTEPKLKYYLEAGCPAGAELDDARQRAAALLDRVVRAVQSW
jgi:phosphomannomutase